MGVGATQIPKQFRIPEADDLLFANEDIVFDFVAARLEVPGESPETAPRGSNVLCLNMVHRATEWSSA